MEIYINDLLEKYGLNNTFRATDELIKAFEKIKKEKQGFLKLNSGAEVKELTAVLDMLKSNIPCNFVINVFLYNGVEKRIQLNSVDEYFLYSIADFIDRKIINELCIGHLHFLAQSRKVKLARYLYAFLNIEGYIEDNDKYGIAKSDALLMMKEIAESEYYNDDTYMCLAKAFYGVFCTSEDLFEFAQCPAYHLAIHCYKFDASLSSGFLSMQINAYKVFESSFDTKLIPNYLRYELARRYFKGIGCDENLEQAEKICLKIHQNLFDIKNEERCFIYDFEEKKYHSMIMQNMNEKVIALLGEITANKKINEHLNGSQEIVENSIDIKKDNEVKSRDWNKVNEYLTELYAMQGLTAVKKKVEEIINSIKAAEYKREKFGDHSGSLGTMHLVFTGNAGTGKTTVARILGKIYAALGVLKRGDVFVECTRADLVDKYVGHTAINVKNRIEEAKGGILFIDEAYSLIHGERDEFGLEAVETLLAEIENFRDSVMVIIAGYKNKMDEFLSCNQGLRSRFATEINFEDYSIDDMLAIINHMASAQKLQMKFDEPMQKYLRTILQEEAVKQDFGNARGVRNIFEKLNRKKEGSIAFQISQGLEPTQEECYTIGIADVTECLECSERMVLRSGKYGKFLACQNRNCGKTISVEKYFK